VIHSVIASLRLRAKQSALWLDCFAPLAMKVTARNDSRGR